MTGGDILDFERHLTPTPVPDAERESLLVNPGFGKVFTEHMVTVRYAESKGWYDARVEPFGPIPMSPATAVLHYAQEIFEGMKAYKTADGGVTLFRPDANAQRFATSARRMAMPEVPEDLFLKAITELVEVDRAWIPGGADSSLYLRPYMIATEVFLGVRPSAEYLFGVIACPVGAYFKGGPKPITLWISQEYTRAAPGGTGAAKCGGNYATSLVAQAEAMNNGCDQVVFLDAVERKYVDELGGMNIFFVYEDGTIITPPLGTILPGITRDSIIKLASEQGHKVIERPYSVDEWRADAASGTLKEAFACGTAAVITPIGTLKSADGGFTVGDPEAMGPVTHQLRTALIDIQQGKAADTHGWVRRVI
ncbi:branched-chain amino acid aminotransferase [Longispora albida]|uniref:branched-chain amino acid aminotransferase n=1 Tax=Longispora albida TaxID=203523 RepID=UPI00036D17DB|nr:branched-chain amino acid aminotransferase [Longispora albida]